MKQGRRHPKTVLLGLVQLDHADALMEASPGRDPIRSAASRCAAGEFRSRRHLWPLAVLLAPAGPSRKIRLPAELAC
jgi:hypothetical protein